LQGLRNGDWKKGKKNGGLFFLTPPTILKGILSLKTQNSAVK
jgi:hypothetical protein